MMTFFLFGGILRCHVQQPSGKFFAKIFFYPARSGPIYYLLNPNLLMIS